MSMHESYIILRYLWHLSFISWVQKIEVYFTTFQKYKNYITDKLKFWLPYKEAYNSQHIRSILVLIYSETPLSQNLSLLETPLYRTWLFKQNLLIPL